MAKWVMDQATDTLDYPVLGFVAEPGDILDAATAPDARWSLNANQAAAETVYRYALGSDPNYIEPTNGHVLTWDSAQNTYVPTAPETVGMPSVDAHVANKLANPASAIWAALKNLFSRKRTIDVRDYGAVGNGVADDTAALQAAITAGGADNFLGAVIPVELANGTYLISSTLVLPKGASIRGIHPKSSIILTTTDIIAIYSESGQGEVIRDLKIRNSLSGVGSRTTYDIEFVNPTKPLIENVEIDLPNADTGAGGIRFSRDSTKTGNAYMPQLKGVWIRNGHLVARGVSDGHFVEGWVWSPFSTQPGSIEMSFYDGNSSDGWTFTSVDVGGTGAFGAGYKLTSVNHTKIIGGYLDGYIGTYGLRAVNSGRIFMSGFNFYQCGYSGIRLENTHGCVFSAVGFYKNNRAASGAPDIELIGSDYNTFQGTNHGQPTVHAIKGAIYQEDAGSQYNRVENAVVDLTIGDEYAVPRFVGNVTTLGRNNRPGDKWPRPSTSPVVICPPTSTFDLGAAATWPAVNRAQFHRFTLTEGGTYRYMNIRVEVASGNIQCAIVKMDGLNYTRVIDSGVIAAASGNQAVDPGAHVYLDPGEYAFVVWCDNTTAQFFRATSEMIRGSRMATEVSSLATGVPATGSIASWSTGTAVMGLTLST